MAENIASVEELGRDAAKEFHWDVTKLYGLPDRRGAGDGGSRLPTSPLLALQEFRGSLRGQGLLTLRGRGETTWSGQLVTIPLSRCRRRTQFLYWSGGF